MVGNFWFPCASDGGWAKGGQYAARFTRAVRRVRSLATEFTRGMEDLASENELGDLKSTIADVKSGNLDRIANKIDPEGELKVWSMQNP